MGLAFCAECIRKYCRNGVSDDGDERSREIQATELHWFPTPNNPDTDEQATSHANEPVHEQSAHAA